MVTVCTEYDGGVIYVRSTKIYVASGEATNTTGVNLGEFYADQKILKITVSDPKSTGLKTGGIELYKAKDNSLIKTNAYPLTAGKFDPGSLLSPRDIAKAASKALEPRDTIYLLLKSTAAAAADGMVEVIIQSVISSDMLNIRG